MAKIFHPKIVSANDLMIGDVVYLGRDYNWTRNLDEAAIGHTQEEADALLVVAEAQQERVVGPYLADVALEEGQPVPLHYREIFRSRGPSNRLDLGRQAEASIREAAHVPL